MTTPTRTEMRADLARAMGFAYRPENGWQLEWVHPLTGGGSTLPDPFTNATDKDNLVKWLAADDARWKEFKQELLSDWASSPEQEVLRYALTAPLETIAEAAWRAIQEQPK